MNNLKERIRELLILNNGNLRINDHPDIIVDAMVQNISQDELNKWANEIYHSINWSIFEKANEKLIELVNKREGIFTEQDAQVIIELAKGHLEPHQVIAYLVEKLVKLGLEPRDRIPLDWSSFINPWMTETAWKRLHEIFVMWLDEKASTLEKMGEISYRKKEETKLVIRRAYKLPSLVTVLTRNSSGDEDYIKIIEEETDLEKRYLRILYHLNPFLPFRFKEQEYKNIEALLNAPGAFWDLAEIYKLGHIHIWVNESSSAHAGKLTTGTGLNDFLTFLYRVDPKHAFYIRDHKFETPDQLIKEIKKSNTLWPDVAEMLSQGSIQVWFAALGKTNWNNSIEKEIAKVKASAFYSDDELWKASVQVLTLEEPVIESSTTTISLVDIEAGLAFYEVIELKLVKGEFVKAAVTITDPVHGLHVTPGNLSFELFEHTHHQLSVRIDPTQMTRNIDHQPVIVIETLYQRIEVPLLIRVVYPKRAVVFELGKYAAVFFVFFGLVRFILGATTSYQTFYNYIPLSTPPAYLPFDFFSIAAPFALLAAGLYYSKKIIVKLEKL